MKYITLQFNNHDRFMNRPEQYRIIPSHIRIPGVYSYSFALYPEPLYPKLCWHLLKTGNFASMLRSIGRTRRFRDELILHRRANSAGTHGYITFEHTTF